MRYPALSLLVVCFGCWRAGSAAANEDLDFFERQIRPALSQHCYACHSGQVSEPKGGLRLDTREGSQRWGPGPALIPGDPAASLLLKAIRYGRAQPMPPDTKLPDELVESFEEWIRRGASDPRGEVAASDAAGEPTDVTKAEPHWAFRPPVLVPPTATDSGWARTGIDRYVWASQQAIGLTPSARVDPRALIRRLHFDLTGLPPSFEQVRLERHELACPRWSIAYWPPHFGEI
jgi:hypothetical protein